MRPWSVELVGKLHELEIESEALKGNHLGDSHIRPVWVYTPPGYEDTGDKRYPSVYVIQGYTGTIANWMSRTPFRPLYPELIDVMFTDDDAPPPCIVVFVDAWTAVGGSQFVDSPGTGNYHTYLCDEVVPFVDAHFRTLADAAHRGIQGKSSGGFGAMITPMLR
ncbi:MAG TPA: alpha/beta hydrolase-fold protein, partial [Acidimicrobiales bacterium]|nr:alpha/beta hydrolase-fold protein [Acidimicrobiales bacterium]